jgi:enoyl-CoA hydratase/carnithine racemase
MNATPEVPGHMRVERVGRHLVLRLQGAGDGPPAVSRASVAEMRRVMVDFLSDPDLRSLTLASDHPDVYHAGRDLAEQARLTPAQARAMTRDLEEIYAAIEALPIITIAAIDGGVTGGGCESILAADIAVATARSHLTFTQGRVGVVPGAGSIARLVRRVGPHRAMLLLATSRQVPAEEARSIGLIDEMVADRLALEERVAQIQASIELVSPAACRAAKATVRALTAPPSKQDLAGFAEIIDPLWGSADHKEGLAAHFARRAPAWAIKET